MNDLSLERRVAADAVAEAVLLCMAVQAELTSADALQKGDRSPVTVADFGAQALVCRRLSQAFPHDPIVAEEDSSELVDPANEELLEAVVSHVAARAPSATPEQVAEWIDSGNGDVADRFWTLDPIDGTKGFLRGMQYAVALALVENGAVSVAVLGCPALPLALDDPSGGTGSLFVAARGQGTEMSALDGTGQHPVGVATEDERGARRFVESVESSHGDAELQEAAASAAGFVDPPLKLDSQVKYGAVARGDAALYLRIPSRHRSDYREKIWDHAAGALIVTEAGGRVTDMFGRSLDFGAGIELREGAGIVASNAKVHDLVLEALSKHSTG